VNTADRRRRVDEIFLAAADLPAGQREAFLSEACGHDIDLRSEVQSLLAHDRDESPSIRAIVGGAAAALVHDTSARPMAIPSGDPHPHRPLAEEGRFVPGTLLGGRYRIIALLGRGGMGEVYRATDLTLGQSVALKFLPASAAGDQRLIERFHGEVRVARQVSHPNVCRVYDIGAVGGMPFLSMEYVDGEDLAALLRRIGRLPADKALEIARKLCAGLAAAHDRGVIHRDLKPANIMINRHGDVLIMDFGLAAVASQLSGPEARNGTPAYMAPERLRGTEVTARSDIYALGLVLYELFTGRRPYDGATVEKLLAQQQAVAFTSMSSLASDIGPAVENAIRRCLEPDPAKRAANAIAVAIALSGGDPLSAAMAAGNTPSPEAVAAAGETAGLALQHSILCLAVALLGLLFLPLIRQRTDAFLQAPADYSPQVLAQKARDIAASFGYPKKPVDWAVRVHYRDDLVAWLQTLPKPWRMPEWLAEEAPVAAEYREAQSLLIADPIGRVTPLNPPPVSPGMARALVDGAGRLREFSALPYDAGNPPQPPISPEALFRAAGLDMAGFTEGPPANMPPVPADRLRSWKGAHPGLPGTALTVEMGSAQGRITWARILFPWQKPAAAPVQSSSLARLLRPVPRLLFAAFCLFAAVLARRNWKSGRAHRKGALRVAAACLVLEMVGWIGGVHAVPDSSMVFTAYMALGDWLFTSASLWAVYLALEPALRSRWPHSIITWNRLLAGQWKDAQACGHILIGATAGVVMAVVPKLAELWFGSRPVDSVDAELFSTLGARVWLGGQAATMENALLAGTGIFFTIFGLRLLVRNNALAAVLAALAWVVGIGVHRYPMWMVLLPLFLIMITIVIFVLLRLGLVAAIAALYFNNAALSILLDPNWNAWYAPYGLATLTLLLAIVLFAFWRSLGGRRILEPIH